MAQLSRVQIEDIRAKADIVEVVSQYLPLNKSGRYFKAICPFHDDHSPSMVVNGEKQIYKCFSCNAGGNVFSFVENYEKVSFLQAVKRVCDICHIPLAIDMEEDVVTIPPEIAILHKLLNEAITFCVYQLHTEEGQKVVDYLHERGLDDNVIDHFQLGYNPKGNALYHFLSKKGYSDEDLIRSGMARLSQNGMVDVFDERIMFPIHDTVGHPIAFSARDFAQDATYQRAKYINTMQTELYNKTDIIYNAHRARNSARKEKQIFVVEGPIDVIAMYRSGIENCVATMGTAFTKSQAKQLKGLSSSIIMNYDGDDAGQNANYKAGEILRELHIPFKLVRNETMLDPDEIIKQRGKNELQAMCELPQTWIEFLFEYYKHRYNLSNYSEKKEYCQNLMKEIVLCEDAFDRQNFKSRLSMISGFDEMQLAALVKETRSEPRIEGTHSIKKTSFATSSKYELCEYQIISQMLHHKEAAVLFEKELGVLSNSLTKYIAFTLLNYYRTHEKAELSDIITELDNEEARLLLFAIEDSELFDTNYNEAVLLDAFRTIINAEIDVQINKLKNEANTIVDAKRKAELLKQAIQLRNKKKGAI